MHEFGMPEICLAREEQNIIHPCTAKQDWKIIFDRLKRTVKLHENEFQKQKLDDFSENSNFHTKLCTGIAKAENYIHESKNKTTLMNTVGVKVFHKLKLLLFQLGFIH